MLACSQCRKVFLQSSALSLHLCWQGKRPYKGHEYSKAFPWSANLVEQQRSYTGEEPFFRQQVRQRLRRLHVPPRAPVVHTGEQLYKRGACEKALCCSSCTPGCDPTHAPSAPRPSIRARTSPATPCSPCTRRSTVATSHPKCGNCAKAFYSHVRLALHQRVHKGDKPFKYCKSTAPWRTNLSIRVTPTGYFPTAPSNVSLALDFQSQTAVPPGEKAWLDLKVVSHKPFPLTRYGHGQGRDKPRERFEAVPTTFL